jgi:hypothetical protein
MVKHQKVYVSTQKPLHDAFSKYITGTAGLDRSKGHEKVTNISVFVKNVKPFNMMYRLSK